MTDSLKRERLAFDDFVFWKFSGNRGAKKTFIKDELNRGLEFPNWFVVPDPLRTVPLNCIPIYIRGKFGIWSDGRGPQYRVPGDVPETFTSETWRNCYTMALDDDSLYYCVFPKVTEPRFHSRKVVTLPEIVEAPPATTKTSYLIFADPENPWVMTIPRGQQAKPADLHKIGEGSPLIVKVWVQ